MNPATPTNIRALYIARGVPPLVGGMEQYSGDLIASGSADTSAALTLSRSRGHLLWWIPWTWLRTLVVLALRKYDLLHVTDALLVPFFQPLARLTRTPIVATAHALDVVWPRPVYQWCLRQTLPRCSCVVAVSTATAHECERRGVTPDRIIVIPNGIHPVRTLDREASQKRLQAEFSFESDSFLLLSVGRLIARKNLAWFVEAVMTGLPVRVGLLVVGEGPERERIQDVIQRFGLAARVRLAGRVPSELRDTAYAGSDLFVMPNRAVAGDAEGFGIVNIEAASHGLPVIAANLEGITEAVSDEENGRVLPTGDADAFLRTISYYLDHELERRVLSGRARDYTNKRFDWTKLAQRYRAVYRNVLDPYQAERIE